jgi:voltage-gated potassium channel
MNGIAERLRNGMDDDAGLYDPSGRLAAYEARTQGPLDLLALITLWLAVVPPWDFSSADDVRYAVWAVRVGLSVVYGIDLAIRSALARRHVRYVLTHPVVLVSVFYPPVRLVFSIRLLRSMFRRGNLRRFLLVAAVLVLNGAGIVFLFERHSPHSSIHTLGESVWWSLETVTTVGYGDYTPVTAPGRVTACAIMGIGLVTLAVITAQVASSFVTQGSSRAERNPQPDAVRPEVTLAELDRRLARIEELLLAVAPSSARAAAVPEGDSGDG